LAENQRWGDAGATIAGCRPPVAPHGWSHAGGTGKPRPSCRGYQAIKLEWIGMFPSLATRDIRFSFHALLREIWSQLYGPTMLRRTFTTAGPRPSWKWRPNRTAQGYYSRTEDSAMARCSQLHFAEKKVPSP
jgi:hypothetical protein